MRILSALLLSLVCTLGALSERAQAQHKRIALLIGNKSYAQAVGPLKNPHNDLELMAGALRQVGFEVLPLVKDARRSTMLVSVRQLVARLNAAGPGAIGFFYYSGHGAAEKDTDVNYLIPIDATSPEAPEFWDESLKLDDILRLLENARQAAHFVVFDACRNELNLAEKSTTKGFIPVAAQAGMFIAYASAPGKPASDSGERSGPYAAALAAELVKPGQHHLDLFQNVKEAVTNASGGKQEPWERNGLGRRVFFVDETAKPSAPPTQPQAVRAPETACDRLAANPDDPERAVPGIDFKRIDAQQAIRFCERARSQYPAEKRFAYQLARAYIAAGGPGPGRELLEGLAGEGYLAAFGSLGSMYADGIGGVTKDAAAALDWYRKGAQKGYAPAMTALGRILIEGTDTKDRAEGIVWIQKAAEAGDLNAMTHLGQLYRSGKVVARDHTKAAHWIEKSALAGDSHAMYIMAYWHLFGDGIAIAKDEGKAAEWFRKAADAGHARAKVELGVLHRDGTGVPRDQSVAYRLFREAAETGDGQTLCYLAGRHWAGSSIAQDLAQAAAWFERAAQQGDCIDAMLNLGHMYTKGEGREKNATKATEWYRKARDRLQQRAEGGDSWAMGTLADMHLEGRGGPKNDKEAFRWVHSIAETGNAVGMANLAFYYYSGIGVEKDLTKAAHWYRRSADDGNTYAMRNLSSMYLKGEGVAKDAEAGVGLLRKAADKGDAQAMGTLGWLYKTGKDGVTKDEAAAVHWYKQSVDKGNKYAISVLATMYIDGHGVEKNEREGVRLLRIGADARIAGAMVELGNLYRRGKGLPKDLLEAFRHYRQAAEIAIEAGDTWALCVLANVYLHGKVITKDPAEAAKWFTTAAEGGCSASMASLGIMHAEGSGGLEKDDTKAEAWFRKATEIDPAAVGCPFADAYLRGRVLANLTEPAVWFSKAAEAGCPYSMYALGLMHFEGRGLPKDDAKAGTWFRKARDGLETKGEDDTAMVMLAYLYRQGRGGPKNDGEAFKWALKSAAEGHTVGMSVVGELYELGHGVAKNEREAAEWYRKGSEAGAETAMLHLGRLHAEGSGVIRNETTARELFRKAAKSQYVDYVWKAAVSMIGDPDFGLLSRPDQTATLMLLTLAAESLMHRERLVIGAGDLPAPVRMAVQRRLKSAGHYRGPVDGNFGPVTKAALEAWAGSQHAVDRRVGN